MSFEPTLPAPRRGPSSPGSGEQPGGATPVARYLHEVLGLQLPVRPAPRADEQVGPFAVVEELGRGGMGEVLRVYDPDLERDVAAKLIDPQAEPGQLARFVQEARITARLQHPGIVPVHQLCVTPAGQLFYTMKPIQGRTLAALVEEVHGGGGGRQDRSVKPGRTRRRSSLGGPVGAAEASPLALLQAFVRVCDALAFAHHQGVIHRDLKPDNIMVGEFGEVLVVDWGLARQVDGRREVGGSGPLDPSASPTQTPEGEVFGTPAYMAPEQVRGQRDAMDARTDVYALGVVLYELLTGRLPYEAKTALATLTLVQRGAFEPPSTHAAPGRPVPWELEAVVLKAMARQPARRYQTVRALQADLQAYLDGRVLIAARYSPVQRLVKWVRRHWLASATAAVGLGLLGFVVVTQAQKARLATRYRDERDRARVAEKAAATERDAAVSARAEAQAQRAAALRERAEVLRMADIKRLVILTETAEQLWPREPTERRRRALVAGLTAQLDDARTLAGRLGSHRQALAVLRARGRPAADGWRFDDAAIQWRHDVLAELVSGLEGLAAEGGLIAQLARRRRRLSTLRERSVAAHRAAWRRAVREIADPRACPAYGGLRIAPQLGLVPLGPDPSSGLWEFACLDSGELPARGADGRLVLVQGSAIVLVLLPGGTAWIGAARGARPGPGVDPQADEDEAPVHEVPLVPFLLGKHELTQGQWRRLTGATPSHFGPPGGGVTWRHPVERISWREAVRVLGQLGLRLPTEAQWEYGARGGTRTIWWTGDDPRRLQGAANMADQRYRRSGGKSPAVPWSDGAHIHGPVGRLRANAFGLHDVAGNVWEWCADVPHVQAYRWPLEPGGHGERRVPGDAGSSPGRALRGGGWFDAPVHCRSANRLTAAETASGAAWGVRPARRLYGPE